MQAKTCTRWVGRLCPCYTETACNIIEPTRAFAADASLSQLADTLALQALPNYNIRRPRTGDMQPNYRTATRASPEATKARARLAAKRPTAKTAILSNRDTSAKAESMLPIFQSVNFQANDDFRAIAFPYNDLGITRPMLRAHVIPKAARHDR